MGWWRERCCPGIDAREGPFVLLMTHTEPWPVVMAVGAFLTLIAASARKVAGLTLNTLSLAIIADPDAPLTRGQASRRAFERNLAGNLARCGVDAEQHAFMRGAIDDPDRSAGALGGCGRR